MVDLAAGMAVMIVFLLILVVMIVRLCWGWNHWEGRVGFGLGESGVLIVILDSYYLFKEMLFSYYL